MAEPTWVERFDDRVAIVTGAAGGIGLATARALAAEGVAVAAVDIDGERMQASAGQIGGEVLALVSDIATPDGARTAVDGALERFGKIDILVNNAGGAFKTAMRPTLKHDDESMRATLEANLMTVLHCTLQVLPHMVERSYGRIVNVGAESVRNGLLYHSIYNAAKGGVHGLTSGIAREFAPHGITANVVAPSATVTERVEQVAWYREQVDLIAKTLPIGRAATTGEVAAAIVFLASDGASYITGQVLSVNGGSSMQ